MLFSFEHKIKFQQILLLAFEEFLYLEDKMNKLLLISKVPLREALKKRPKKFKNVNLGLTPPPFSKKVKNFFFRSFLRLDYIWGTFGKKKLFWSLFFKGFPYRSLLKKCDIPGIKYLMV